MLKTQASVRWGWRRNEKWGHLTGAGIGISYVDLCVNSAEFRIFHNYIQ